MLDPDSGVVTSVVLDANWLVAGLVNHHIHIFSTHTGSLMRTLVGHELGVWAVDFISCGGASILHIWCNARVGLTGSSAAEVAPSHEKRKRSLLQPYELSRRLITLCQSGDVDLAVTTLRSAPRNAQNVKVWNTLIQQCMDAKKYIAFSVFTDVRPARPFIMPLPSYAPLCLLLDWC